MYIYIYIYIYMYVYIYRVIPIYNGKRTPPPPSCLRICCLAQRILLPIESSLSAISWQLS